MEALKKWSLQVLVFIMFLGSAYFAFTAPEFTTKEKQKFVGESTDGIVTYYLLPDNRLILHVEGLNGEEKFFVKAKVYGYTDPVRGWLSFMNRLRGVYIVDIFPEDATKNEEAYENDLALRITSSFMMLEGEKFGRKEFNESDQILLQR